MERIWIFMKITEDIIYAGVNDHQVDLFEGQYRVPNGMAYNSYVILDEKTAVMDTVHSIARNRGMTKHAVISSASSENTVCRYRSS